MLERTARTLVVILCSAACAGAGADADGSVERVDSAGVELVRNRAAERPLGWRFERVLTLGGVDEGPQAFARLGPESVATDDAGRIHVADGANHRIRVFDETGTQVRELGGRGGGPGEFEFMGGFAVSREGAVLVADFTKRGLVAFDADGTPLPLRSMSGFPGSRLRFVDGGLAAVVTPPATEPSDSSRPRLLVMTDGDTTALAVQPDVLDPEFRQLPRCSIGLRIPPLLTPTLEWDGHGGRIAVTDDADYAIDVWERSAVDGTWRMVRRVLRTLRQIPATVEIAATEYPDSFRIRGGNTSCAIGPAEIAEALGFAEVAPHVKDLAMAPDGTLWIRHRTADEDVTRTDVFDGQGEYLGTLATDAPFPAAFRGRDQIVSVETDELDRPLVVVWRIVRN